MRVPPVPRPPRRRDRGSWTLRSRRFPLKEAARQSPSRIFGKMSLALNRPRSWDASQPLKLGAPGLDSETWDTTNHPCRVFEKPGHTTSASHKTGKLKAKS